MIKPSDLQNNMVPAAPNDRPFDFNEPATRGKLPTPEELEEIDHPDTTGEPGEHEEKQHPTSDEDVDDIS